MADVSMSFSPCCFCGRDVEKTATDPCRVTVETVSDKWQVWTCHGACFRQKLGEHPEDPGLFEPAHF